MADDEKYHDWMHKILSLNQRLSALSEEFENLHKQIIEDKNTPEPIKEVSIETRKAIALQQNKIFDNYHDLNHRSG